MKKSNYKRCDVCGTWTREDSLSWGVCSVCVAECPTQAQSAQWRRLHEKQANEEPSVIDNGDGSGSFGGTLVGMGF